MSIVGSLETSAEGGLLAAVVVLLMGNDAFAPVIRFVGAAMVAS